MPELPLHLYIRAMRSVWTAFPRTFAWLVCMVVGLFAGWNAAFGVAVWVYCALAIVRAVIPYGTNAQELLCMVLFLSVGPTEIPIWIIISVQISIALEIAWPLAALNCVGLYFVSWLVDRIVMSFLRPKNLSSM